MDLAPEILLPDVEPGTVLELVFQASTEKLTVVAQDPEQEPLAFVWQVPRGVVGSASTTEEAGGLTYSILDLPADPVLHGAILTVTVFDPGGNDADLAWALVVP